MERGQTKPTKTEDPIERFQEQVYALRRTYVTALSHCEQAGQLRPGETLVGAAEVKAAVEETIKLAEELLPQDLSKDELEKDMETLVQEDAKANQILREQKERAEKQVESIRSLREQVVKRVLLSGPAIGDMDDL
jgi:hypothetical protein